jgi:hypothetical protein
MDPIGLFERERRTRHEVVASEVTARKAGAYTTLAVEGVSWTLSVNGEALYRDHPSRPRWRHRSSG